MLLLFLSLLVSSCVALKDPVVYTEELGYIEGFHYKTSSGFHTSIFLGIPYAQPPVGLLRFEKPLPFAKQPTSRIKAKKFGHVCYPAVDFRNFLDNKTFFSEFPSDYSEDCLTINIVTPYEKGQTAYPVLVFIHGGGFEHGSSIEYGYKQMAEHLVPRGIIFVSFHYRVGFLGFLSNGDNRLPGNLGLWDQTRALQFIHDNIVVFGGDQKRITVMGSSAGSISVSALTISPHSFGLFNQVIGLGGSALTRIAINDRVVESSRELITKIGCENEETDKIVKCLKSKTIDELYSGATAKLARPSLFFMKFHPRIEEDFFQDWYLDALRGAPKKATLIGAAEKESILFLFMPALRMMLDLPHDDSKLKSFSENDFIETINDHLCPEHDYGEKTEQLRKLVTEFYLRSEPGQVKNSTFYLEQLVEAYSDIMFHIPDYIEAEIKMRHGWPIYLYQQEYANLENQKWPVKGAMHLNDLIYLFNLRFGPAPKCNNNDDDQFVRIWFDVIESFLKTGNPSTEEVKWDQLTKNGPSHYLSLKPQAEMKPHFRRENMRFWTERVPKDILNGILSTSIDQEVLSKMRTEL